MSLRTARSVAGVLKAACAPGPGGPVSAREESLDEATLKKCHQNQTTSPQATKACGKGKGIGDSHSSVFCIWCVIVIGISP